jgi:hypothetical protein
MGVSFSTVIPVKELLYMATIRSTDKERVI